MLCGKGEKGVVDLDFGGAHGVDGEIGIHVADFRTNGRHQLIGISDGAEIDGHFAEVAAAEIGNESLLGNFVAEIGVLEILDDTDDLHIGGPSRIGAETDVKADGISSGEKLFGKFFVDHDGGWDPVPDFGPVFDLVVVANAKVAAGDDGYAERGKIIRANLVHVRLGVLIGFRWSKALDGHAAVPFVVFENAHGREADGLDAGNCTESVSELWIEDFHALGSVAVERRIDLEGHEPLRGKAGTEIAEVGEAANEKAGSDEKQKGERYLGDDETLSQTMVAAATDNGTGLIFQGSGEIGLGGLKSGHEAEDDSGEDCDGEIEEENTEIGRAGNVHAAGIGRQIDFHEGPVGPKGDGEAGEPSQRGKRKTFDQELADDARTSGAHGQTNGDFLDAAGAADEQEVGQGWRRQSARRRRWWPSRPKAEW